MIGDRIKQARVSKGLSLRTLAAQAGIVTFQAISNYETGQNAPSSSVLLRLADALGVEIDYFFRSIHVELGEPAYRKHCSLTKTAMRAVESRTQDILERFCEIEQILDLGGTPGCGIPTDLRRPLDSVEQAEDRADSLRKAWKVGIDPIDNLTELLEGQNIKVVYVEEDEGFDGCSYPHATIPVIVVNSRKPTDRMRLNLAHELGHTIMHFHDEWGDKDTESAAYRFAGSFLAPKEAVYKELGASRSNLSIWELVELKKKYGLSMQAWVRRARDLEIISSSLYAKICKDFSRRGWRKTEPVELPGFEKSTRLERLVARALSDGIISEGRAAELLGMGLEDLIYRLDDINGSSQGVTV